MASPYNSQIHGSTYQGQGANDDASPNRVRMKLLSEKWQNIQHNIDRQKEDKREVLAEKIQALDERISKERPVDEQKFKILKEQVVKLQEDLQMDKQGEENSTSQRNNEFKVFEEGVAGQLDSEKGSRRQIESNLLRQIDDKINSLNLIIQKNAKNYEENTEKRLNEVNSQVQNIADLIGNEEKNREQSSQLLNEEIQSELNNFHDTILIERKIREEMQNKIVNMTKEIHVRLQQDLVAERKERENIAESLIRLLEETSDRMDKSLR